MSPRRRAVVAAAAAALATACALTGLSTPAAAQRPARAAAPPRLSWDPCPQLPAFDCATATAPLDYDHPEGRSLRLAVIRHRAADPAHRIGTLFFNPGGPGVAGTLALPLMYDYFPSEVRDRFDIVSWDPRGVGRSTAVRCFASAEEATAWAAALPAGFPVGARQRARWISAQAGLGRRCERRDPALLRHISTEDTARDLDLLRSATGRGRLTYFGISYGTYLGATYANLFPGRVRAMVLDGNVDPWAWNHPASPLPTFLRQGSDLGSSATLAGFLDTCGRSTPRQCAFSAGDPAATRRKFEQLLRRLREHPVGQYTYSATVAGVAQSLYTVHPAWTTLADALQSLWLGRAPEATAAARAAVPYPGFEQLPAVVCADSPNPRDPGRYHDLEEYAYARSGDVGRDWAWTNEVCATWPARAAHRYTGPWDRFGGPVLTVGITDDPATPYHGTLAMAHALPGARLLTVAGYGHSALLNPSTCANRHEARYLLDGALPPPGTVCAQDTPPFRATAAPARPRRGARTPAARPQDSILARYSLGLTP